MNTLLLADSAPTGAGLPIVGAILLGMLLVALAVLIFVARFVIRKVRGERGTRRQLHSARPPDT